MTVVHPGPRARKQRTAAALTLSETAYKIRVDMGRLSRYERGIGNLTDDQRERLEKLLGDALRDRARLVEAAIA